MKIVRPVNVTSTATLARSSSGTYLDKNGVLQTAPNDTLRITYDQSDLTKAPYALIEPSAVNLLASPSDFTAAGWGYAGAGTGVAPVVTPNGGVAPDGVSQAQRVVFNRGAGTTSGDYSLLIQTVASAGVTAGGVFLKSNTGAPQQVVMYGTPLLGQVVTITSQWQRFQFSDMGRDFVIGTRGGNVSGSYAGGDTFIDLLAWGSSLEVGTAATSFTPTSRSADIITGTGLLYSNIPENDYPEWNPTIVYVQPGTNYPTSTAYPTTPFRCIVAAQHSVYESVVGIRGIATATGGGGAYNFMLPSHGLSVGDTVLVSGGTGLPSELAVGTLSKVSVVVDANNFRLATFAGAAVSGSYSGQIDLSGSSNYNQNPVTDTIHWVKVGATNKWSPYDQSITSQATSANEVVMAIVPGSRVDTAVGLNITASTAQVSMVDAAGVLVYRTKVNLTSNNAIQNWYSYFYEPVERVIDFSLTDLPIAPSALGVVVVRVPNTNGTAGIGGLVLGLAKDIGITESSAKVGVDDYSVKTRNDFGTYVVTPRAFSKNADFTVHVPTATVDYLENLLATYRSTPVVYIGSNDGDDYDQYTSTTIYGFYKTFQIDIQYQNYSVCTMTVEGLT